MAKKDKEKLKDEQKDAEVKEETVNTAEQAQETEEDTNKEEKKEKTQEQKLKEELDTAKQAHIRTLAEYDNFRKRTQKEKDAIYGDSKAKTLSELLPVLDNFERAALNSSADFEAYKKGVEMTFNSMLEVLKKLGVEPFGESGDKFDPNIHNAVMHCEDESLEENVVTDVFSKGYKLGDRVLRPAMVKVAN